MGATRSPFVTHKLLRDHNGYNRELRPILEELASYGPRILTRALLVEAEKAEAIVAQEGPERLKYAGPLLNTIRAYCDGSPDAPRLSGKLALTLQAERGTFTEKGGGHAEAVWQLEWACFHLAGIMHDVPYARFAARDLVAFETMWSRDVSLEQAWKAQVARLKAYLDALLPSAAPSGNRSRTSLLADRTLTRESV